MEMRAASARRALVPNAMQVVSKKLPLVGSFFLAFSIVPFFLTSHLDWYFHDLSRIAQVVLVLLMSFCSFRVPRRISNKFVVISLLLLSGVVGAGRWGAIESLHFMALIGCAWIWFCRLRERPEPQLPSLLFGLSALYLVLVLLPRWMAFASEVFVFYPSDFFSGFENPRFFGHWVTLTLPLMVHVVLREADKTREVLRHALWVVVAMWVAFAIASGTRGSWLALGLVTMALPMVGPAGAQLARGTIVAAVCGLVIYLLMFLVVPFLMQGSVALVGVERLSEGAQLSRRDEIWSLSLKGIAAQPFLGAGPMMFAATNNGVGAHPHNVILQLAYEWGLPLTILLVYVVFWAGLRQLSVCRQHGNPLRTALLASITGGLIQAQLDGILVMPFSQTLFALLCAWLASLTPRDQYLEMDRGFAVRALCCACAIALGILCLPELQDLRKWETATLDEMGASQFLPRFWVQGVIPADSQSRLLTGQ